VLAQPDDEGDQALRLIDGKAALGSSLMMQAICSRRNKTRPAFAGASTAAISVGRGVWGQ